MAMILAGSLALKRVTTKNHMRMAVNFNGRAHVRQLVVRWFPLENRRHRNLGSPDRSPTLLVGEWK